MWKELSGAPIRRSESAREQALIGEVVDGQDRGDLRALPRQIGRRQRGLPVIGMDQVGCPILVQSACGKFGGGGGEAAEPDVVVRPVAARFVAIGIARPVVKLRAEQDVNRQAILGRCPPERAGRHLRQSGAFPNDFNVGELFDDVPITGQHDPDVTPAAQCPGQGGGNGCETAHPDEVIHFSGDEQDLQGKRPRTSRNDTDARMGPTSLPVTTRAAGRRS